MESATTAPKKRRPSADAEYPPNAISDPIVLKNLHLLRRELHDLQDLMSLVQQNQADPTENVAYINKTISDIKDLMKVITSESPAGQPPKDDAFRHLHNLWEELQYSPLLNTENYNDKDDNFKRAAHHHPRFDELVRRMIYQIVVLTVPTDLAEWLKVSRPGYYIPFHDFYADQLPNYNDRVRLLEYLKWTPNLLKGGLVDEERGFIYRYETNPKKARRIFALLFATLGLATAFVLATPLLNVREWNFENYGADLLIGWIAVLGGLCLHIAVEMIKHERPPIIALGDVPLLINARAGNIIVNIVLALFAYFAYIFTVEIEQLTLVSAFLIGYSLDSFVGMFNNRIKSSAEAQLKALQQTNKG